MLRFQRFSAVAAVLVLLTSCASLRSALQDDAGGDDAQADDAQVGAVLGFLGANSDLAPGAAFAVRSLQSVRRANADLTPQQEHYLGRAFGAQVLAGRAPLGRDEANRYLNQVGQALARFSERPETWGGYRFLILDSAEVNAFAAPGGFVFVTRGLLRLTRNEAELAAVLAHEIAHIEQEHGLKAIRKDRLATAVVGIGSDAAQTFGGSRLQELSAAFEDSIADLTKTIVNSGYSRETEFEADASALAILTRAGYPPQALLTMLEALKKLPETGKGGFSRTHPTPDERIFEVKPSLGRTGSFSVSSTQKQRFQTALGGL